MCGRRAARADHHCGDALALSCLFCRAASTRVSCLINSVIYHILWRKLMPGLTVSLGGRRGYYASLRGSSVVGSLYGCLLLEEAFNLVISHDEEEKTSTASSASRAWSCETRRLHLTAFTPFDVVE